MKITVLGGGNGSLAAAADFAFAGHEVTLWRRGAADVAQHHALNDSIMVRDAHPGRTWLGSAALPTILLLR